MQIVRDTKYLKKLQNIMSFIAKDGVNQAVKFQIDLDKLIDNLSCMPYKSRESIYFYNEYIRDLVFKKYVIPYKIDTIKNQITIIGINKYQKKL